MEITRTFDILDNYLVRFPEKQDALAAKKNGSWITFSSKEYVKNANYVSCGLLQLGISKGDRILSVSNNRPEWNFLDMGMSQIGAVHVPVYPTISREEYQYILQHCEPKIIVVSDKSLHDKIRPIAENLLPGTTIFTFNDVPGARNFDEILRLGESSEAEYLPRVQEIKKSITPDDLLTIIYTSGTTGNPKGVMLSHRNVVTNAKGARNIHWYNNQHKMLSFLPICHVFERTINYHVQMEGIGIYYAENLGTIGDNLREVKPELMISVPRLIEKVYDKIIGTGKSLPYIKKQIFFWAVNLGLKYDYVLKGSPFYRLQLALARKLVFSKWQASLGGNLGLIVVGGAALQPRLSRIFGAAGIPTVEGYGLTESSPVIAANNMRTGEVRVGTVGPVFENVEVRIAEDGEILTKGPCVMMGYYKDPEKTKEAIDEEGWLHTGDIGILVEGKYLKITDRKKEIFKLSSGKYIAPQSIENMLKESMFIEQAMVIGENQKFASALIAPNFSFLHNWAFLHHVNFHDNNDLISNPQVVARYQKEIARYNKQLGEHERIKRFRLVADEWSPQTGELSPTLKLKRRVLLEKYSNLIDEIFSVDKDDILDA